MESVSCFAFCICTAVVIMGGGCTKTSPAASDGAMKGAALTPAGGRLGPVVVSPAPVAVAAAPDAEVELVGAAGASGAANGMAVVIVMLPATDEANGAGHPHKYKLSLTADTENASVEVDGQPMGAARIQRVYPQMRPERAPARTPLPVAAAPSLDLPLAAPRGIEDARARSPRVRATPTPTRPLGAPSPPIMLSSNGAPIID
jgi:hypothetical protein